MKREEQIKEAAKEYTEKIDYKLWAGEMPVKGKMKMLVYAAYEDACKWADEHPVSGGADSRDEEIKQWKESKRKLRLRLMQQIHELRNPWISVDERLPEKAKGLYELEKDERHKMVLFKTATGKLFIGYLDAEEIWRAFTVPFKGAYPIDSLTWSKVTHWMPIQQLSIEERLIDGLQELNEHFKKGE